MKQEDKKLLNNNRAKYVVVSHPLFLNAVENIQIFQKSFNCTNNR